jgi:hypothetical protein
LSDCPLKPLDTCRTLSFCLNRSRRDGWKYLLLLVGAAVGRFHVETRLITPSSINLVGGRDGLAPVPRPRFCDQPEPKGSATNLVALPDFTRISPVCLPALVRSAISLLTSDGLDTVLPPTSRISVAALHAVVRRRAVGIDPGDGDALVPGTDRIGGSKGGSSSCEFTRWLLKRERFHEQE